VSSSVFLELPYIEAAQAQKHVTHNEAVEKLDVLVQLAVSSNNLSEAPEVSQSGERFIVGPDAIGIWAGHEGDIAIWSNEGWSFVRPLEGWRAWVISEQRLMIWTDGGWAGSLGGVQNPVARSPFGAQIRFEIAEEELSCAGDNVQSTIVIPNRAILFGVCSRTTETITGATSYDCGLIGEKSKFGGFLGISSGSTNAGVIGPTAFYVDTPIVLTANDAEFTGGRVRLSVHYGMFTISES